MQTRKHIDVVTALAGLVRRVKGRRHTHGLLSDDVLPGDGCLPYLLTILTLAQYGPVTYQAVADRLGAERTAVYAAVRRLHRRGLVEPGPSWTGTIKPTCRMEVCRG